MGGNRGSKLPAFITVHIQLLPPSATHGSCPCVLFLLQNVQCCKSFPYFLAATPLDIPPPVHPLTPPVDSPPPLLAGYLPMSPHESGCGWGNLVPRVSLHPRRREEEVPWERGCGWGSRGVILMHYIERGRNQ